MNMLYDICCMMYDLWCMLYDVCCIHERWNADRKLPYSSCTLFCSGPVLGFLSLVHLWTGLLFTTILILGHCPASRKVAGKIGDGVIEIFHWLNPSSRAMAVGSTQPLTEMSTTSISWGAKRPVRRAENLTTFIWRLSRISGSLNLLEP
jgi:hypothetical protein